MTQHNKLQQTSPHGPTTLVLTRVGESSVATGWGAGMNAGTTVSISCAINRSSTGPYRKNVTIAPALAIAD
jgi:hypothetical protein